MKVVRVDFEEASQVVEEGVVSEVIDIGGAVILAIGTEQNKFLVQSSSTGQGVILSAA